EGSDGGHRHDHSGTNQVGAVAECTGGARPRQ
ncbi:conjugative transfer relaxase TraI, partial [Klebsiella pneumoniae]